MEDSVNNSRKTIALFNKDWNTYKANWINASGGLNGKLSTLVNSNDVNCIKEYNNQIQSGVKPSEAYKSTMAGCTKEAKQTAVALAKGTVTYEQAASSLGKMTLSAKASQAALSGIALAGNMVVFALVSKGIELAVKAVDNWVHRVERANEAMAEAVSEYDSARSNLEGIHSKLEEQDKRIRELLSKDKLTYTEKGELEELQKITNELLLQQDIEERNAQRASKDAARTTVDAYETQYGKYDSTKENLEQQLSSAMFPVVESSNDVTGNIAAYIRAKELLAEEQEKYNTALKNGENTESINQNLQHYLNMVEEYEKRIDYNTSDLQEKKLALAEEYSKSIEKKNAGTSPLTTDEKETIETYEAIADTIRFIYEYTNQNAWNNMEISNIFSTEGIEKTKEELIAMEQAGELTEEKLKNYPNLFSSINNADFLGDPISNTQAFYDEISAAAEEASKLADSVSSQSSPDSDFDSTAFFESISEIQEGYSTLLSAQEEYNENGAITASTLKALMDNDLLAYLQYTSDGLSVNTAALETNEQALKDTATAQLYNAMCTDIQNLALSDTGILSEIAQTALANLNSAATTAGENASIAANGWWEYGASIQSIPGVSDLTGAKAKEAEAIVNQYKKVAASINSISIGNNTSPKNSSSTPRASSSSGANATDPVKDQFQTEYDLLKHNLEMEYITEENYYNSIDALNQKYFAGKKNYLDEYKKYEEEVYKGLQKYYKSYIEAQMNLMDTALEANKISYQYYSSNVSLMLSDMYQSGKISAQDYFSYTQKMMEKQLSVYQSALNGIISLLNNEVKKWEDKIELIEKQNDTLETQLDNYDKILSVVDDVYQKEIDRLKEEQDNLQSKIDALNEEADAYELIRRKEEALYALRRAEEQRTNKVFVEGQGFLYTQDQNAVREAQDNLSTIKQEELVNELEQEKDTINDSIELLEKYREQWAKISSAKETETNRQLAIALFGQNYEQYILQNRTSDIETFKENYLQIQAQLNDNTSLIESYEQKIEYYNQLKEQWQSITDAFQTAVDAQNAAQLLGADWETQVLSGRLDTLNTFRNEYIALQQGIVDAAWNSANAQIQALNAVKAAQASASVTSNTESAGSVGKTGGTSGSKLKKSNLLTADWYDPVTGKKGSGAPPKANHNIMTKYGAGTINAKRGLHEIAESGDELIVDTYGNAFLAKGHQLHYFQGGEVVKNPAETSELLKNAGNLTPFQQILNIREHQKHMIQAASEISTSMQNHTILPDYSYLNNAAPSAESILQTVTQNINVTLPGITDFRKFQQEMSRYRLDAYQHIHKRHS